MLVGPCFKIHLNGRRPPFACKVKLNQRLANAHTEGREIRIEFTM